MHTTLTILVQKRARAVFTQSAY